MSIRAEATAPGPRHRLDPVWEPTRAATDLQAAALRMQEYLQEWARQLGDLDEFVDALQTVGTRLQQSGESREQTARRLVAAVENADQFDPRLGSVSLWAQMVGEIRPQMRAVPERLGELRTSAADAQFRITLSQFKCEAIGQFAALVVERVPGHHLARAGIERSIQTLRSAVLADLSAMGKYASLALAIAGETASAAEMLDVPTGVLAGWRDLARRRDERIADAIIPDVARMVTGGQQDIAMLRWVSERCRAVAAFVTPPLAAQLDVIEWAARRL
ncbi:MAG: hypothetical protein ACK5LN_01745 [Propioniciclava sp.]